MTSVIVRGIRKLILSVILKLVDKRSGAVIFYKDEERAPVIELFKKVRSENKLLLLTNEAFQLHMLVKNTLKLDAPLAEVGCFMGGSSKIICEAKGQKTFYIFDTFEGLPDPTEKDNRGQFSRGDYAAPYEFVKSYLSGYPNVHITKGLFPASGAVIESTRFSFVHLDLDLYESTLASLQFFYPRIVKGGVLVSHDYVTLPGVRRAFDEFFADKPEPVIEMSGTQCVIVKC